MQIYKTEKDITAALTQITAQDDRLSAAFAQYGTPPLRQQIAGFAGLARLLISQQVSTAAAAAIQARFEAAIGDVSAENLLAMSDDDLGGCGISRPKQKYLRGLGEAVSSGAVDFKTLNKADDETVFEALVALKGIGPWTAQCYLLFALRRTDLFPSGDLALQHSVRMMYRMDEKPSDNQLAEFAMRWQPHRAAAARLLWSFYNGELAAQKAQATK